MGFKIFLCVSKLKSRIALQNCANILLFKDIFSELISSTHYKGLLGKTKIVLYDFDRHNGYRTFMWNLVSEYFVLQYI